MTRKVANPDAVISELAGRQHGVVSASQLVESGVPRHAIRTRVGLRRLHRGRAAFREDKRRDLALGGLGYQVVRLSEQQLNEEGERVADTLAQLLDRSTGD